MKVIGFDFDGTLIMSEDRKKEAMVAVFNEKFGVSKGVGKEYALLHGMNRNAKVEKLFEKFLGRKVMKKELKIVADHFGEHYIQNVNTCPLLECADVLKKIKVDFMFLLSLENQKEVKKIAKHCGIAMYFDEILGGPRGKLENFKHVLKDHKVKPSEVLYVGDAHSDVVVAKKLGVKVAIIGKKHLLKDENADFVIKNLCELEKII